jgi:hypothetical protein
VIGSRQVMGETARTSWDVRLSYAARICGQLAPTGEGDRDGCIIDHGTASVMTTATGLLGGHAYFLHWGVVQISLANFLVILVMLVVFVLALVLPFPGGRDEEIRSEDSDVRR